MFVCVCACVRACVRACVVSAVFPIAVRFSLHQHSLLLFIPPSTRLVPGILPYPLRPHPPEFPLADAYTTHSSRRHHKSNSNHGTVSWLAAVVNMARRSIISLALIRVRPLGHSLSVSTGETEAHQPQHALALYFVTRSLIIHSIIIYHFVVAVSDVMYCCRLLE